MVLAFPTKVRLGPVVRDTVENREVRVFACVPFLAAGKESGPKAAPSHPLPPLGRPGRQPPPVPVGRPAGQGPAHGDTPGVDAVRPLTKTSDRAGFHRGRGGVSDPVEVGT